MEIQTLSEVEEAMALDAGTTSTSGGKTSSADSSSSGDERGSADATRTGSSFTSESGAAPVATAEGEQPRSQRPRVSDEGALTAPTVSCPSPSLHAFSESLEPCAQVPVGGATPNGPSSSIDAAAAATVGASRRLGGAALMTPLLPPGSLTTARTPSTGRSSIYSAATTNSAMSSDDGGRSGAGGEGGITDPSNMFSSQPSSAAGAAVTRRSVVQAGSRTGNGTGAAGAGVGSWAGAGAGAGAAAMAASGSSLARDSGRSLVIPQFLFTPAAAEVMFSCFFSLCLCVFSLPVLWITLGG